MQRIAVVMGDGARAALGPYYRDQDVPGGPSTTASAGSQIPWPNLRCNGQPVSDRPRP